MHAWTGKNNGHSCYQVTKNRDLKTSDHFHPAHADGLYTHTPNAVIRQKVSWLMEKAGYLQRTGIRACDSDGVIHEVIEAHIHGSRYALRRAGLAGAVTGRVFVQVEEMTHNWNYYLGATRGLAQVSQSGKALNIDLFNDGSFTVSLRALRNVMYGKDRYAYIMKIPEQTMQQYRVRRVSEDQKQISATA